MSFRQWLRGALIAVVATLPVSAMAQNTALPVPFEAYGEDDPSAVAPKRIDPTDNRARATLEQILQYDPQNVSARIQNAELMIARGMRQRGLDEYAHALNLAAANEKQRRTVHWNYGWALFNVGEARGAISQWMQAETLHGGRPVWVPTTYAIGLFAAGERDLAMQFYKSAVRSNPRRWGEPSGLKEATKTWPEKQRLALEAVYAAWREGIASGR
jgi:Tfp pilus assembly protein PilF